VLATRVPPDSFEALKKLYPDAQFHERSHVITLGKDLEAGGVGNVLICCAGTSDLPVAEEAAITAQFTGSNVTRLTDVGVAGIHRLLGRLDVIRAANVIVVAAGMEGALASVIGGLVEAPVIAVPTSVGYGASFGGISALLTMLNSCSAGVTVVNIDNGFGAGFAASLINKRISSTRTE
jgi:NCAIR mutase (PurE)-related protein